MPSELINHALDRVEFVSSLVLENLTDVQAAGFDGQSLNVTKEGLLLLSERLAEYRSQARGQGE